MDHRTYLFDVDGTLTPSRQTMDKEFVEDFLEWILDSGAEKKSVYLVTGSDIKKTREQVPGEVLDACKGVFACLANQFWVRNKVMYAQSFLPPKALVDDLNIYLEIGSSYSVRTGNHIEMRPGMVNFSVVGRNATREQRLAYKEWDDIHKERYDIADYIASKYPYLEVAIGGSISVDIYMKGSDKSQAIKYLKNVEERSNFIFVGDRTEPGGNDYAIVREIDDHEDSYWFRVESWEDTRELLRECETFI